ncbi:MAG TPA: transketolase [bacterium]|nr:transketolase [bacterium]HQG45944.1 transketolase [bacterium]HQI48061.1 transketolase [bacterium]HQJ63321.1 transketolase [bacterium]
MIPRSFDQEALSASTLAELQELARQCRGDILKMTTLAASGHPGGSMSSIDFYLTVFSMAHVDPQDPFAPARDRIVTSHGHTSPGVFSALGRLGFFHIEDAVAHFRQTNSPFEGHVEREVPGVDWGTGNLGQGLSALLGLGLGARLQGHQVRLYGFMGDGEQQKGQIAEARRFAVKYGFDNATVIVDYNRLQISGSIEKVMPQHIRAGWEADGWRVLEIDGHDFQAIYQALREAHRLPVPVMILAHTVMSKGVPFMENDHKWHGQALPLEECRKALALLGLPDDLDMLAQRRKEHNPAVVLPRRPHLAATADPGTPRTYGAAEKTDNRSGWGSALDDLVAANHGRLPIAVFDCDLGPSVKTTQIAKNFPDVFFQGGIQEHNTAAIAGACSAEGVLTYFADFGVFGVAETFNQHRLNDINGANYKVICTHVGLDVGEDGKTHQSIDYVGAFQNFFGFKVIVPADPNQTDRATRYLSATPGNFLLAMGRSKMGMVLNEAGQPFYGEGYTFRYGKADLIRNGLQAAIIAMGGMVGRAVKAWELLQAEGIDIMVFSMSCPTDPDLEAITLAAKSGLIVTYEDHNVHTGLGSAVANSLAAAGIGCKLVKLGISRYGSSGIPDELYKSQGLDPENVAHTIRTALK